MLSFFPKEFLPLFEKVNLNDVKEIRLREGQPIIFNLLNEKLYARNNGLTKLKDDAIKCDKNLIEYILLTVTENSIYSFNDKIKEGFVTTKKGIRIGICGECVKKEGQVNTIKNITSLNIRIPHKIVGCSKEIFKKTYNSNHVYNSLIISPPGCGKTTIIKDLIERFNCSHNKSILIIDERGEFIDIKGENIDKIENCNKLYALNYGVRCMTPEILFTDEISSIDDWICVENAVSSGVKVFATAHSNSIESLIKKSYFKKDLFERYFVLHSKGLPGRLKEAYDGNLNVL